MRVGRRAFVALLALLMLAASSCAVIRSGVTHQTIASEYYSIAEAYADLEKYDKAIPYYEAAARQKQYKNAARYGLGRMYALTGDWEKASDIFKSLLSKDPENEMLEGAYSFALVSQGKTEKALPLYKGLMDKHPDDPARARDYVAILVVAKQYEDALDEIAATREKFPDSDVLKDLDDLEAKASAALAPPEDSSDPKTATKDDGKNAKNVKKNVLDKRAAEKKAEKTGTDDKKPLEGKTTATEEKASGNEAK
jgi:tetratricopeptide (TPR) repeat protein